MVAEKEYDWRKDDTLRDDDRKKYMELEAKIAETAKQLKKPYIPTLCLDFDGVLHSYTSGWQGKSVIPDPPVDGAIEWLRSLLEDGTFKISIYSSRSATRSGIGAMQLWLAENGLSLEEVDLIDFPMHKPAAFVTLDDRAITFTGVFPDPEKLRQFKPWNKAYPNKKVRGG